MSELVLRKTTIGYSLANTVEELVAKKKISEKLGETIMAQFDKSIISAIESQIPTSAKCTFKGHVQGVRRYDNVWMFNLDTVEYKQGKVLRSIGNIKLVAQGDTPIEKTKKNTKRKKAEATTSTELNE
jgi:hypothetical protein